MTTFDSTSINDNFLDIQELDEAACMGVPIDDDGWGLRHLRVAYVLPEFAKEQMESPVLDLFYRDGMPMVRREMHLHDGRLRSLIGSSVEPFAPIREARPFIESGIANVLEDRYVPPGRVDEIELLEIEVCRAFKVGPSTHEALDVLATEMSSRYARCEVRRGADDAVEGVILAEEFGLFDVGGSGALHLPCGQSIRAGGTHLWFVASLGERSLRRLPLTLLCDVRLSHLWLLLEGGWRAAGFDRRLQLSDGRQATFDLGLGDLVSAN